MNNNALEFSIFYLNGLHLVKKGKLKLCKSILRTIDFIINGPKNNASLKKCNVLYRFQFKSGRVPSLP